MHVLPTWCSQSRVGKQATPDPSDGTRAPALRLAVLGSVEMIRVSFAMIELCRHTLDSISTLWEMVRKRGRGRCLCNHNHAYKGASCCTCIYIYTNISHFMVLILLNRVFYRMYYVYIGEHTNLRKFSPVPSHSSRHSIAASRAASFPSVRTWLVGRRAGIHFYRQCFPTAVWSR